MVTRLRSDLNPTMCVNIKGALTTSGTTAVQWPCGNAANENVAGAVIGMASSRTSA